MPSNPSGRPLLAVAILQACLLVGCLYVPPVTHTAAREDVLSIQPGVDTRASIRRKLGRPNILELATVYAWDWAVNRGSLAVGFYPAYGWSFGSGVHRVLVQFDGDRVVSVQHASCDRPDRRISWSPSENKRVRAIFGGHRYTLEAPGELLEQDLATLEERLLLPAWEPPQWAKWERNQHALGISPDGRWIVTWWAGVARIWDAREGRLAATVRPPPPMATLKPGGWSPCEVHFTAAGDRVLLGDPIRGFCMLGTSDWRPLWVFPEGYLAPLALAPDGSRVLALTRRGLNLLDGRSGELTGGFERRGLERWFNASSELDWPDFRLDLTSPEEFLAIGPATRERWSIPEVERSYREGRGRVRVDKDRSESALLGVELLRFTSCP